MQTEQIKCPWCGKLTTFSKRDNLAQHRTPGNTYCVGVGQPRDTILQIQKQKRDNKL